MTEISRPERGRGLAAGVSAYLIWGFFPLLFPLAEPAVPLEILAHRIVWSLVAVALVLAALRTGWGWLRDVFRRDQFPRLVAASVLISVNWLVFMWAVNSNHVVEASLGYFVNPLLNIVFGVLFFDEPVSHAGRMGAGLATAGVVVIAWQNWATLWVSLSIALSFACYGAVKKRAVLPPLQGLFVESALVSPLAIGYLLVLAASGVGVFGTALPVSASLVLIGVLTPVPLWLFAFALPRLPFGVVGILQYLGPTIQFILGLTVFGQHVDASYWAGLVLVWLGSAVYLAAAFRGAGGHRRIPG